MKLERQREHHVTRDGIIPSFGSALSIDGINLVVAHDRSVEILRRAGDINTVILTLAQIVSLNHETYAVIRRDRDATIPKIIRFQPTRRAEKVDARTVRAPELTIDDHETVEIDTHDESRASQSAIKRLVLAVEGNAFDDDVTDSRAGRRGLDRHRQR